MKTGLLKGMLGVYILTIFIFSLAVALSFAPKNSQAAYAVGDTYSQDISGLQAANDVYFISYFGPNLVYFDGRGFSLEKTAVKTSSILLTVTPFTPVGDYQFITIRTAKGADVQNLSNWLGFSTQNFNVIKCPDKDKTAFSPLDQRCQI